MKQFDRLLFKPGRFNPGSSPSSENDQSIRVVERIEINPTLFSEIAGAIWKMRQKLQDPRTGEMKEEMRSLSRYVDSIIDSLADAGIEIQDHTNAPFDSGQSLEVLAFQPTAGILREVVLETIRPSVYLKGRRIQMGQVIVATPDTSTQEK
jgi:hypothetical protein